MNIKANKQRVTLSPIVLTMDDDDEWWCATTQYTGTLSAAAVVVVVVSVHESLEKTTTHYRHSDISTENKLSDLNNVELFFLSHSLARSMSCS